MLEKMRLPSPDNIMRSYPFQLSGGMRQRVGIAMGMTYQRSFCWRMSRRVHLM